MVSLELEARLDNLLAAAQEETADIDLFAPIAEREECPICMIPLPLKQGEVTFMSCCGKEICSGCTFKDVKNDRKNGIPQHEQKCAFCRQPEGKNNEIKRIKKLMKKNNPKGFLTMGIHYKEGDGVIESDTKALEMYIRAAELGKADAYVMIGLCYQLGSAVERDMSKAVAFYEVAAKKGAVVAHISLAHFYTKTGDNNKRIKHLRVAASAGEKYSMDDLMSLYKDKELSKEDLTQILREFQTSSNEMKSKDRDDARAQWK